MWLYSDVCDITDDYQSYQPCWQHGDDSVILLVGLLINFLEIVTDIHIPQTTFSEVTVKADTPAITQFIFLH